MAKALILLMVLMLMSLPVGSGMRPGNSYAAGIVDPCSVSADVNPGFLLVCPQGDGDRLDEVGCTIFFTIKDGTGAPIPNIPAADFWVVGWNDGLVLCGGSGSADADSTTNGDGLTTMSGAIAAGGSDEALIGVVQGIIIPDNTDCFLNEYLAVRVASPDINGDLIVDIIDFSLFGPVFPSPPNPYDERMDFNDDGLVDIIDFSLFGQHFLHVC